jgi:mannitol/fructose-specific phosphotransferase system IIA component (Ntr-type)
MRGRFHSKGTILLTEILDESCVRLDVAAPTKDAVIEALVGALVESGAVTDASRMVADIQQRERVMSTGIGGGIAVPHAQSPGATRLALALGRLIRPIDFDALDERPVQLVFLVAGPEERGGFIRVLARISRLLYSGDLQRNLLRARTPAEAMACIRHEEERITG